MVNKKPWEDIQSSLTEQQVISVLTLLGSAPPVRDKDNNLLFQSVCHDSQSWKLCYYTESKTFFCYKEWEDFNIFSLVEKVKGYEFPQALKFVCDAIGYSLTNNNNSTNLFNCYAKEDWDILEKYNTLKAFQEVQNEEIYDESILKMYSDLYYEGWIEENISVEAMKKYGIKYDIANNRIIIPHRDIQGNLVGIRCRNLDKNATAKYCPIQVEDDWYSHSLSNHLYGLYYNQEVIKRLQKVMICESEKASMQAETYFPNNNFVVSCCGSNISLNQIKILLGLGVKEVQLGMDFDFHQIGDNIEYLYYQQKILKLARKLIPYFEVYYICGFNEQTLGYKYSPTDFNKELLIEMMKHKTLITEKDINEEIPKIETKIKEMELKCQKN